MSRCGVFFPSLQIRFSAGLSRVFTKDVGDSAVCTLRRRSFHLPPACQNRKQTRFMTSRCLEERWIGPGRVVRVALTEQSTALGLISALR